MPLRNLQIEVRQLHQEDRQETGSSVAGAVQLDANGQLAVQGRVRAQDTQQHQSTRAEQQVLVLNGRSARIALRTSTPLRLMQSFFRNGVLVITQGTVWLDSGTGFVATPRWDGSDRVELEIAAQQALGQTSAGAAVSSSLTSVLLLPLGEWMTVAQSDQESADSQSGLGNASRQGKQSRTDVQLRLTVR